MLQFLADQVDQLDLALDQLAIRDRNFDRFALMLIDNVVELTLHQIARDKAAESDLWRRLGRPRFDPKLVTEALGPRFDAKVRLARQTAIIPSDVADSILFLHGFRNTVYHTGLRHERILHALGLFYFQNACTVLRSYLPRVFSCGSSDRISHRALKYIGRTKPMGGREQFDAVWTRLAEVGASLGDGLAATLHEDVMHAIQVTSEQLDFLAKDSPTPTTRSEAVIAAQAWPFAFSDEGKSWAAANHCPQLKVADYVKWVSAHYPWPAKADPIAGWLKRSDALAKETDKHVALKRYCDFMRQTEVLRAQVEDSAAQLDGFIQHQIDIARGK